MHGYREFPQFNIDVYCLIPPPKKTGNLMDIDIPKIAMFKESFTCSKAHHFCWDIQPLVTSGVFP